MNNTTRPVRSTFTTLALRAYLVTKTYEAYLDLDIDINKINGGWSLINGEKRLYTLSQSPILETKWKPTKTMSPSFSQKFFSQKV